MLLDWFMPGGSRKVEPDKPGEERNVENRDIPTYKMSARRPPSAPREVFTLEVGETDPTARGCDQVGCIATVLAPATTLVDSGALPKLLESRIIR